ncbi:restriction endonuclease subunit S [Limosilactobacillus reuteri]|uniref:Type I restriction modification DNA specificity domain-containing protein n=1 Tax=Limosilactobacillus reuteri TaxID=1598 RepID=A0A3M6SJ51_LIMRT|nr:restriction endonuclease subunit S [Limosilactobacillus reuteri]QDR72589.1 hypothetical protein FOD75_05575 [Limosilactobacillus reuteri]RMX27356.1 hypothetical protein C6H63_05130 [Limosilactobacillus reuteri]
MKLIDLCIDKAKYGINASAVEKTKDEDISYLRITDIKENNELNSKLTKTVKKGTSISNYLLKENDIVFARTGNSVGKNYFYDLRDGKIIYAGFLVKFSINPQKVYPKYIKYYMQSYKVQKWIKNVASDGSTRPNINAKQLGQIPISLPSKEIQEKIANSLWMIDTKIKLNNQINDNLVELINLIYLKFCADFPAKEKVSLDDVFNTSTKTFNVNENKNINIWHFSIPNFDCNKQPQCESTNSIKSNKKKVNSFGVLVSKLNPNFKRIWAPNLDFYSNYSPIASPEFIQINGNSQEEQALIFCILNSEEYTDFLVSNATGSTNSRQRVKPKIAVSYIIPFDLDKKKGLESLVSPILKDIQQREFENTKLQIIKDTLLNKYF